MIFAARFEWFCNARFEWFATRFEWFCNANQQVGNAIRMVLQRRSKGFVTGINEQLQQVCWTILQSSDDRLALAEFYETVSLY